MTTPTNEAAEKLRHRLPPFDGLQDDLDAALATERQAGWAEGWAGGIREKRAPGHEIEASEAAPSPDLRCNWRMESLIRYAVEVWGPESDVDPEADNGSMRADLETFLDVAAPSLLQERDRLDVDDRPCSTECCDAQERRHIHVSIAEYDRLAATPTAEEPTGD